MKITKEEFDKLYDDNITKKDYDLIVQKIEDRFCEIVLSLCPNLGKGKNWFDFDNCGYEGEDPRRGYFSPQLYKTNILIGGSNPGLKEPFEYKFPTSWLWEEDYKEQYQKEVDNFLKGQEKEKLKIKNQKLTRQETKNKFKEIISSKLTQEELKYIKFK